MSIWISKDAPRQDGRRAVVTGGVSGIGFEVARVLGSKGAQVLIASRDRAKGDHALAELRKRVPEGNFAFDQLDLADLASIADFASRRLDNGEPIDLLLNVAGVMAIPTRMLTKDGFEMHMGTNHLGHFALTGRLLPALKAGANPRVITISALVARYAKLDLDDLQSEKDYAPMRAYGRSKLANVLFGIELQRRASGLGIASIPVDPGTANTALQRNSSGMSAWMVSKVIDFIGYPLDRVADPAIFAATVAQPGPEVFIGPTKIIMSRGAPGPVSLPKPAEDAALRAALWEKSESLTGVGYDLPNG
jgi:NAD(P)-dependent dehydrogenase (short-subunit alcohol dehydrogenase family)